MHVDDVASGPTQRLRIALVGCSGLLGDIIGRAVQSQADLEVVADLPAPDPSRPLPPIDADVVLWNGAEGGTPGDWLTSTVCRSPRVLATVYDGREAWLWQLVPRRRELGALSPSTLVDTIRGLAPAGGEIS